MEDPRDTYPEADEDLDLAARDALADADDYAARLLVANEGSAA